MVDIDKETSESEINLLEFAKELWNRRKFIIKISLIGLVVGVIVAFSIPKGYTTSVVLTTDSSKQPGGNMGALASIAGINLANASSDIFSPEIYPEVLKSTPFTQELLKVNVEDQNKNINTSLYNYLMEYQEAPWWNYIFGIPGAIKSLLFTNTEKIDGISSEAPSRFISAEEMKAIEALKGSYSISTDKKTGITIIQLTAQSPAISAFLADTITSYLQTYIIDKRTQKARIDLENNEKLYEKSKADYHKAQQSLATFVDGNLNVISAKYKTHQERLQNEANLAYGVYTQMAQQVQMNRLKVQDDTPVFTIIQPGIEPIVQSKPNKKLVVITFLFLSFVCASGWVLRKQLFYMHN